MVYGTGYAYIAVDRHRCGTRRPTRTASPRRRSTTPTSDSRSASRWASRRRAWTEPYWGGAYYHPGLLGRLSVLRVGERQCLRPLGQHHLLGHAHRGTPAAASRARPPAAATTTSAPARRAAYNAGTPVQRLDRQRIARLRPHRQQRGRRLRQRRARQQLQRLHRAALDRLQPCPATTRGRQHLQPRRRDDRRTAKATRTSAAARRYNAKTGQDQQPGAPRASATITTPTSTATSITNNGSGWQQHSSERLGQRVGRLRRGPTGSRRRAAPAMTAGVASRWRRLWWLWRRWSLALAVAASAGWRLWRRPLRRRRALAVGDSAAAAAVSERLFAARGVRAYAPGRALDLPGHLRIAVVLGVEFAQLPDVSPARRRAGRLAH